MAVVFKDRVREFVTVQGLGPYQLLGPVQSYQPFSIIGDGSQCYYAITDGISWETGLGTYALSTNTLARTSVEESSNANSPVNWTPGDKTIWLDFTALAATAGSGGGSVTNVSVQTANGLAGTVANPNTTPAITLSTTVNGVVKGNGTALSAAAAGTDYQAPVTLTTTGSSGAATFVGNTLNIPNYSFTDTGITQLTGGVTAGPGSGSQVATVVTNANLTGEATSVGNATTLTNAAVIGKVLTGYVSGAGTISATDSILQAIQKLNGNAGGLTGLANPSASVGLSAVNGSATTAMRSDAAPPLSQSISP